VHLSLKETVVGNQVQQLRDSKIDNSVFLLKDIRKYKFNLVRIWSFLLSVFKITKLEKDPFASISVAGKS
jgi:hypothetical protein